MKFKLLLIPVMFLLVLFMMPITYSLDCRTITDSGQTWNWPFNNKGHYKLPDTEEGQGRIVHIKSNTAVSNFSASGAELNQLFTFSDLGWAGAAGNTSRVYLAQDVGPKVEEFNTVGNGLTDIDLSGVCAGSCTAGLSLTPNSSHLWIISGNSQQGKLFRYDFKTATLTTIWDSEISTPINSLGIYVDEERVFIANSTHIRQLEHDGTLICDFEHGITSARAYLSGNTTNLMLSDDGANPGDIFVFDVAEAVSTQGFTLTATDTYDDTALTNITVSISNSSFSFNTSTVNGTILLNTVSIPSFNKSYDIIFRVNDSGGYFNRTFFNINISNTNSFKGDLFQSVLRLKAIDGLTNLTISDFTASTNNSINSTTTGELFILIKNGTFQLNVTALGFDKVVTSFSIGTLINESLNVSMGSIFTFKLIREETNTPFNFNLTNSTDLTVFCANETIRITFNTTNNISQIINCQFELMQMTVNYGVFGSYFRTLIPSFSQKNITWYLIDLIAGDTAIQKIIQLVDLTGDFTNSTLTVKRAIPGETTLKTMIQQKFDISNEVNLFLVKDALYTINIENEDEDIVLGNLIPTEAGTQTITLPKIDFVPQETTLGDDVSWSYTFNITLGILRLQYVDTTNLTTLVRFTVRNGSSPNLNQLFLAESNNNATVTMTFNQVLANTTYVSELFFIHPGLSNFTETRPWYEFGGVIGASNLEGWSDTEQINFKKWATWIFLAVWGMFWSRRYIGIGMTTLVIWLWIFRILKWVDVSNLVFGFVALLAVVGWIVEAMKKE